MKNLSVILGLLVLATSALAQDSNAKKLTLAHDTIAAMHADKMLDGMAAQMKQMATRTGAVAADATPEQKQRSQELQDKIMDLSMNAAKGMISQMDQIYADVYSEAELMAMKAFFTSPEGQSMMAKQPQIMARLMPIMQGMQGELMPKIQKLVEESRAAK